MSGLKKGRTAPMPRDVWIALASMSKAALLDCLADALAIMGGGNPEDITYDEVREFVNPRLRVRGDRLLSAKLDEAEPTPPA